MATSSNYKSTRRSGRVLSAEQSFALGMHYMETNQLEGANRALVNYDIKDQGAALIPRGGMRVLEDTGVAVSEGTSPSELHHTSQLAVVMPNLEDELHKYMLFSEDFEDSISLPPSEQQTYAYRYSNMHMLLEDRLLDGVPVLVPVRLNQEDDSLRYTLEGALNLDGRRIHGVPYTGRKLSPVYATLNNLPYFPYRAYDTAAELASTGLARLELSREDDLSDYTALLKPVVPREITPTEAINYGYNMLSPTPYAFNDSISPSVGADYIILDGILAYEDDACTLPLFGARVGSWVTFRLFARFHATGESFRFKWEIRDMASDDVTIYEDIDSPTSKAYHYDESLECAATADGERFIKLRIQPPYKQFSVIVTVYSETDLTEPIQVMTLASYTMSSDPKVRALDVKQYRLFTAQGMTTWQRRLVLWGPLSGRNMIFISDINDPSYFPYPNNTHVFDENVVSCVPYLSDLLVFTESKLHRLSWDAEGMSYSAQIIQDKLMLSTQDVETIQVVKNMVFFKNGNYFYMIVPGTNTETQELQLAPISRPVTNLLDNFETSVMELFMTMYGPERFAPLPVDGRYELVLQDFHNYLDNTAVRNVYKFQLRIAGSIETLVQFDFLFNYDTMLRTWTAYIVEGNRSRMVPYRQTITDTTMLLNLVQTTLTSEEVSGILSYAEIVKVAPHLPQDLFGLDLGLLPEGRRIKNWQYLDTGHREQIPQHKKRYREIQLRFNNIDQETMEFGVEFSLDDELRKELFQYDIEHNLDDPSSPDYGWIYVTRNFAPPAITAGATILESSDPLEQAPPYPENTVLLSGDVLYSNRWVLGFSKLAKVTLSKVAIEVSGKGYSPQLKLLSFNEQRYEYLGHNWVYRVMNAR